MRVILRHAALRPEQEQRVRLAANTLAAHGLRATTESWDGTRCSLLLANADDGYGRHVIEIARRRAMPVLAFAAQRPDDPALVWVPEDSSVAVLAKLLHAALEPASTPASTASSAPVMPVATSAPAPATKPMPATPAAPVREGSAAEALLLQLGAASGLAGRDLEVRHGGRSALLLPSAGRVLTASHSDHVTLGERLAESGWTLRPLGAGSVPDARFEVSSSLEAFLLQGALRARASLPAFPDLPCGLDDWPDLGATPEAIDALRVVQALYARRERPSALIRQLDIAPDVLCACLWAFAAAGLLQRDLRESATVVPLSRTPRPAAGLLARLAAHFGLSRVAV